MKLKYELVIHLMKDMVYLHLSYLPVPLNEAIKEKMNIYFTTVASNWSLAL